MQRKLSEIAEIPKILSSTLATVSQTFNKLMPSEMDVKPRCLETHRKYSYDEDALDYELSDNATNDSDTECEAQQTEADSDGEGGSSSTGELQFRFRLKEETPESDYVSETIYLSKHESDGDVDELTDDNAYVYVEHYVQGYGRPRVRAPTDDDEDDQGDDDDDDDDDDGDFQNTSYTWNLRNIPKLTITDDPATSSADEIEDCTSRDNTPLPEESRQLAEHKDAVQSPPPTGRTSVQTEKFERSWPWADRERIIYKQSTCHLVPSRPLGLIEKRIQLLAKQNLVDNLKRMERK